MSGGLADISHLYMDYSRCWGPRDWDGYLPVLSEKLPGYKGLLQAGVLSMVLYVEVHKAFLSRVCLLLTFQGIYCFFGETIINTVTKEIILNPSTYTKISSSMGINYFEIYKVDLLVWM